MVIKNILRTSAELLDLKDVIKYLDGEIEESEEISGEVNNLMLAINMVNNTIASSYIDLINEVDIMCSMEVVPFDKISDKSIIEVRSIESTSGKKITFKILPEGIKVDYKGECKITYTYFPEKVTIDDEINYYLKLNEITFAMGVVGEYLYIKGVIDDAYMWDKRFKSSIFNLLRPRRNVVIPARRW